LPGWKIGSLCQDGSSFYAFGRACFVIEFDQLWGMCLIGIFPNIVAFRVSLPFDQVLEPSGLSMMLVASDCLHFELLFSIDKVRWWSGKVWAV
jgi:hypothetical protein